jgi:hypothetical protein
MNTRLATRSLLNAGLILIAALASLSLLVVIVNLAWFDEVLRPELVALRTPQPVSMEDNSYALVLGFLAADEQDPRVAGQEIVQALRQRYEQGQRIALSPREMGAILGGPDLDAWEAEFESLECSTRVYMDCAERLMAEVSQTDSQHPRLSVLFDRYDTIVRQTRYEENQERDVYTPFPPYQQLARVGRLRLALSYRDDSTREFLEKAAADFEFWTMVLRESEALAAKMVSLAGIQNNLDFLSTLMRNRTLSEDDIQVIRRFVRSFTSDEIDIGEAFISEARIAVLSEPHPMTFESSWISRLVLQENATLNEEFLTVFAPVRLRASLTAQEYYRQKAYEPLPYDWRLFPPPLYNLGGKLARRSAWGDAQIYLARVHDQNGRISLVLLQAEIEQNPDTAVEDVIRLSDHRNSYTDDPMEYDAQAQTIGFECLHTVYHPPAPPDVCSFRIGRTPN